MRWMNAGLTAAVLFSAPVLADDAKSQPGTPHAETMKHSTDAQQGPADQAATLAHQHATVDGSGRADAMHAAMANKAAMSAMSASMMGGASGTCQAGSDCQNAAGMTRMMATGAGMMNGSTSGGAAMPGTTGPTTGASSMPMGGKR